jgi:mRNA-degrading endonuclease RelE of RelBE toxin-antitoxin system
MVTMTPARRFALVYASIVKQHLTAIERKYHSLIRSAIEAELQFEPDVETKNRKPFRRPVEFEAQWELRLGPDNRFRVFYQVDVERSIVHVLAIGVKHGDRLRVGDREVRL